VASDGLPITSISFSLKSSVATQWLREQGVVVRAGQGTPLPTGQVQPVDDQPLAPSAQPQAKPVQPLQSDLSLKPTIKPDVVQPDQVRPYNLDQLISDRAKAEADLEDMIKDMRGKMDHR
jgi:serine protease Do